MKLDPNPKQCTLKDESCGKCDGTATFYANYVFREQPVDVLEMQSIAIPFGDIAADEFNQILPAEGDDGNANHELLTQSVPFKLQDERFPRILFLGTGAGGSFMWRNSAGILVHLS